MSSIRRPPAPVRWRRGETPAAPALCGPLPALPAAIGIDLAAVAGVALSIETFGARYLERVFTPGELAYCMAKGRDPAPHLAARFAAKEATFKALRQGDEPVDWRSVEVVRRPDGSCHLLLHGGARALAERRGLSFFSVSLSHDGGYAAAIVVGGIAQCVEPPKTARRSLARLGRKIPRGAYER